MDIRSRYMHLPDYEARLRTRFQGQIPVRQPSSSVEEWVEEYAPLRVNDPRVHVDRRLGFWPEGHEQKHRREDARFKRTWNKVCDCQEEGMLDAYRGRVERRLDETSTRLAEVGRLIEEDEKMLTVARRHLQEGRADNRVGQKAEEPPFLTNVDWRESWLDVYGEKVRDVMARWKKRREREWKQQLLSFRLKVIDLFLSEEERHEWEDGPAPRRLGEETSEEVREFRDRVLENLPVLPGTRGRIVNTLLGWVYVNDLPEGASGLRTEVNEGISLTKGERKDYVRNLEEHVLPRFGWKGVGDLRSALRFAVWTYAQEKGWESVTGILENQSESLRIPDRFEPSAEEIREWLEVVEKS